MALLRIYHGDMREILEGFPDNYFTHVLTDPPYELGFFDQDWDKTGIAFDPYTWKRVLRVTKPGGYMMCFGGSRTVHRMACAIEDAGWQLVDTLMWLYSNGFPKALDVSKAVDKLLGEERHEKVWRDRYYDGITRRTQTEGRAYISFGCDANSNSVSLPASTQGKQFSGYRTQFAPAYEPILLCMKPTEGTYAENALKWGVAGLNIDRARIPLDGTPPRGGLKGNDNSSFWGSGKREDVLKQAPPEGRYPKNVILDGSDEVTDEFERQSEGKRCGKPASTGHRGRHNSKITFDLSRYDNQQIRDLGDKGGSAARYFYSAKVSPAERGPDNNHPTVKPLALLDYCLRLLTPPGGGLLLDPFLGSGSTLIACARLCHDGIGIELEREYVELAERRIRDDAPMLNNVEMVNGDDGK